MAPHDVLLKSICHSAETFREAQNILRAAKQRTGPLSGYNLGSLITGLPAICAYIASTNLNNTDVTRKNAQIASCLKESDFEKVLETVQAALDDDGDGPSPSPRRRTRSGYDTLLRAYPWPFGYQQHLDEWTSAVKRALVQRNNGRGVNESDVENAIFFWTFTEATGNPPVPQQHFAAEHCTSVKSLNNLLDKINECCVSLKTRIQNDVLLIKAQRSPAKSNNNITTPRRTPKRPLRILPSRDSPSKRKTAQSEPPVQQHQQHECESDDELELVHETPSKKRKAEPKPKPKPTTFTPTDKTRLVFPPIAIASSSRVRLDRIPDTDSEAMDVDADDVVRARETVRREEENDDTSSPPPPPIRRRYRSVYVDHKQWYAVDRRVRRVRKQAEWYRSKVEVHGRMNIDIESRG